MPAGNIVYFYVREEEKNPAVFKKKKGGGGMRSKNNGAHTECLVSYLLPCLKQELAQTTLACVHPLASPSSLLPPLQGRLPQRTAGSSRISSTALLHNAQITDYSLLLLLLDLKFGEVEGHHFSLLTSVSNMMLVSVCSTTDGTSFHKLKCFLRSNPLLSPNPRNAVSAISRSKHITD